MLLYFWSDSSPKSRDDLEQYEKLHATWGREGLQLLTINVDAAQSDNKNEPVATSPRQSFPTLTATPELIAVYNLLYRQLFDRHRDLTLPISFLVDNDSAIVKVYQGAIPHAHYGADFKTIPRSDAERVAKALPFPGLSATY